MDRISKNRSVLMMEVFSVPRGAREMERLCDRTGKEEKKSVGPESQVKLSIL
jgi:hypothetical protein